MSAHTPGPWTFATTGEVMNGYSQPYAVGSTDSPNLICGCFGDGRGGEEAAKANARLIAAAPDMLKLLESVPLPWVNGNPDEFYARFYSWFDEVRPIVAKARGEA